MAGCMLSGPQGRIARYESKVGAQPSILPCEQGHFPQASASLVMAGMPSPLSTYISVLPWALRFMKKSLIARVP